MFKYFLLVGLLIPNPESQAANIRSPLNRCAAKKLTHVVASNTVAANAESASFSFRLRSRSKSIVEINCRKM